MESPISDRTSQCLTVFEQLQSLVWTVSPQDRESNVAIVDSTSRCRLWAVNFGAFHPVTDRRSADYRLHTTPTITRHLLKVLDELYETLRDIQVIVTGKRVDESLLQSGISSQRM